MVNLRWRAYHFYIQDVSAVASALLSLAVGEILTTLRMAAARADNLDR
jgi:hypothetical protein